MNQQEPAGRPVELLLIPATSVMWGDCEILHAVAKNLDRHARNRPMWEGSCS